MGLTRTVSEIDSDFSQKSQFFPPLVFCAPAEGVPIGIWYRRCSQKKLEWWATGRTKKFDDNFSRVDRMHQRDRQTDRQTDKRTDTERQQRPRLRIASRVKNSQG